VGVVSAVNIVIVGAGGHGQVVADVLLAAARAGANVRPVGYVDDDPARRGKVLLGLPVLGDTGSLSAVPHDAVIVAIGDIATRRMFFERLQQQHERFAVARHPGAIIAEDVVVGPGTMICAGAIVNPGSVIGSNVILNTACTIDHHNHIGDHVHVAPRVCTGGDVTIGRGALVGIGAVVMPGRRVGADSIVGAGAVVHQDVPESTVVVGVPARAVRSREFSRIR
jgi:sugar O-acyltransferase (sialic acid O-acetyltransferase NeuD family)